jgi:predicted nucleic acid-binding protein
MSKRVYAETSVFLSYMLETPNRIGTVEAILREASRGELELYTSVASIVEIAYLTNEAGNVVDEDLAIIERFWASSPIRVVENNLSTARLARDVLRDRALTTRGGPAPKPRTRVLDSLHLATAVWIEASEFWSYDDDFSRYQETVGNRVRISPPSTSNPMLGL